MAAGAAGRGRGPAALRAGGGAAGAAQDGAGRGGDEWRPSPERGGTMGPGRSRDAGAGTATALLGSAAGRGLDNGGAARNVGGVGRRRGGGTVRRRDGGSVSVRVCVSSVWRACVCVESAGLSPGTTLFAECRIGFAECRIRGTRQRHFKKKHFIRPLPSARSAGTRQSLGSPSAWHSANKFLPIQF